MDQQIDARIQCGFEDSQRRASWIKHSDATRISAKRLNEWISNYCTNMYLIFRSLIGLEMPGHKWDLIVSVGGTVEDSCTQTVIGCASHRRLHPGTILSVRDHTIESFLWRLSCTGVLRMTPELWRSTETHCFRQALDPNWLRPTAMLTLFFRAYIIKTYLSPNSTKIAENLHDHGIVVRLVKYGAHHRRGNDTTRRKDGGVSIAVLCWFLPRRDYYFLVVGPFCSIFHWCRTEKFNVFLVICHSSWIHLQGIWITPTYEDH